MQPHVHYFVESELLRSLTAGSKSISLSTETNSGCSS